MPKVHKQVARKDYPEFGIKKGDVYYWWKFRYSRRQLSLRPPKPAQLTQSGFLQEIYEIEEEIQALDFNEDLEVQVDEILSRIEALRDEQEEKKSNMPEQLQDAVVGELLQERYDALDEMYNDLSSIDLQPEVEGPPDKEVFMEDDIFHEEDFTAVYEDWEASKETAIEEIVSSLRDVSYNGS